MTLGNTEAAGECPRTLPAFLDDAGAGVSFLEILRDPNPLAPDPDLPSSPSSAGVLTRRAQRWPRGAWASTVSTLTLAMSLAYSWSSIIAVRD